MSEQGIVLTPAEIRKCQAILKETRLALETGPQFRGRWALGNLTEVLEILLGGDQ